MKKIIEDLITEDYIYVDLFDLERESLLVRLVEHFQIHHYIIDIYRGPRANLNEKCLKSFFTNVLNYIYY